MALDRQNRLNPTQVDLTELLNPGEIINAIIDSRIQLSELERQIQAMQPAFFAACIALNRGEGSEGAKKDLVM